MQVGCIAIGVAIGCAVNFWVIWANNQAAGLFAPQDKLIFDLFVNKPYTKICAVFLGIAMGQL
jgi:hypothetical protein